jgi:hypothetical protein
MKFRKLKILFASALFALAFQPHPLFACAACYGASDSPMAKGMNWGIFSLLGVVAMVLGSVATFFVFIGKRAAAFENSPETESAQKTQSTEKV